MNCRAVDRLSCDTLTGDGGEARMCGWLTDRYGLSCRLDVAALEPAADG
jgi:predicted 3-demethylubiquinone-9 3-methyltransferase (glyoxalase superfamily)